jgi:hypothetical protein
MNLCNDTFGTNFFYFFDELLFLLQHVDLTKVNYFFLIFVRGNVLGMKEYYQQTGIVLLF